MDIQSKKGSKVRFIASVTDSQISWGHHTDPSNLLVTGEIYTIDRTEVHSWHTKVYLEEVEGTFNSVWFDGVDE